jgi:hypothetical protein
MRTTIDMPDALYRRTKAVAALRGSSLKDLIIRAIEKEVLGPSRVSERKTRLKLPHIRLSEGRKLDLTGFDFDDLLVR